jgi:type VI secretion system VasD/TssJ family lipoprotein
VQVRLYQLQSDAKLRGATFEEIWQKGPEVLATDLKSVTELTVFPGKGQDLPLERKPDANFFALVALFREPKGTDWYVTFELPALPQAPPCAKPLTIPVYLDRMQIKDGEGPGDEAATPAADATTEQGASSLSKGSG